jgi:NHLM bacteriocin system ABC transporter peptidase/ATP-binding protein
MEAVECGAAALAIVLAYHGRHVPLEEVREACGISRDGSRASNVLRAARHFGMEAKGKRLTLDRARALAPPFVVFWGFNHFLVVEGFSRGKVFLNDPALGRRTVAEAEFDRFFTGIALVFSPGPHFAKTARPPGVLRKLVPFLRGSRPAFAYVALATLLLVVPGLAIPVFSQIFVDEILVRRMTDWVGPLLLGMALTAVLRTWLTWMQQSQLARLESGLSAESSASFFWHVLRLPLSFFEQRHPSDIGERVEANARVARLASGGLATNAANLLSLVFFAALMFQYDWFLTLVGIGVTGLNLILLRLVSRQRRDHHLRVLQDRGKLAATTAGGLRVIETIKASGGEHDLFLRWTGLYARVNNLQQRLLVLQRILAAAPPLLGGLATVAILGLGGWRVLQGELTVGMLVAFQSLMQSFVQPVNNLLALADEAQEAGGDLRLLDDVSRHPVDPRLAEPAAGTGEPDAVDRTFSGNLELRGVSFGYNPTEGPLVEGLDLRVEPGRRVALVGPSGSGKSTVAKLVSGLREPWSGEILFDGTARSAWPRGVLEDGCAHVDQTIHLFSGTIRENLSLWDPSLAETDLTRAARDAALHDEIISRPGGYDAPLEEGGRNLSGGQRQRLEIARALARDPRLLVLDEATAALDARTEKRVDEAIRRRGCACLIIAHRLSTIRDCDEILVLDRGKVVERGTHGELVRNGNAYVRMLEESA